MQLFRDHSSFSKWNVKLSVALCNTVFSSVCVGGVLQVSVIHYFEYNDKLLI